MRDKHHILFNRQEWRLRNEAKALRENPTLIPELPREVHEELHANCTPVPLLGYYSLVRVVKNWYPQRDTLKSMDDLMVSIDIATQHPSTHQIERDLGGLTIQAIELQKPYIREGLIIPDVATIIDLAA